MPEESETLPLLGDSIGVSDASLLSSSTLVPNSNGEDNKIFSMPTNPHLKKVVVIIACLVVVADMSDFIRIAPKLRIFESSICRDYYRVHDPSVIGSDGNVPESLCKIGEVQSDLALLNGWLNVVQNVPSLLVAIPYGILADIKGRKFVFQLNVFGQILAGWWVIAVCYFEFLPIKAVWASGAFYLIGGGSAVLSALALAIIADVAPPSQRSIIFFLFAAAMLITEVLAPILSSSFMSHGFLYLPILLGVPFEIFCFYLVWLLPETLKQKRTAQDTYNSAEDEAMLSGESCDETSGLKPKVASMKQSLIQILKPVISIGHLALKDIRLMLALFAFMVNKLQRQLLDMMVQYSSARLKWTVAQAGYLVSLRAGINIIVLLLILPLILKHITRIYNFGASAADLWLAKASSIFMVAGCLMMGFSASAGTLITAMVVFTSGSGFRQLIQSYITSLVEPSQTGSLYTLVSILDGTGAIIAAALLSSTFSKGIKLGGVWQGLPFLVAACLYALASVGVWMLWADGEKAKDDCDDNSS